MRIGCTFSTAAAAGEVPFRAFNSWKVRLMDLSAFVVFLARWTCSGLGLDIGAAPAGTWLPGEWVAWLTVLAPTLFVNSSRKKLVGFVQVANSDGEDSSEMSKDIDWISRVRKYRSDANLKDC
jgi:hypothetical protein